ncbi:MAG: hypothetical protein GY754_41570 [bacterium]|nr:hypothetical protein [bacterium]
MSVKKEIEPNWLKENDWTPEKRLEWAGKILANSPRDWRSNSGGVPGSPDPETWALWCLLCCDTKERARKEWFKEEGE